MGRLDLSTAHHHRLPWRALDYKTWVSGHAEVDEPCLGHLVDVDAVFCFVLGWRRWRRRFWPQGGGVAGQDDVAGVIYGLVLCPGELGVQLFEDIPITNVDGLGRLALVFLQSEGVVGEVVEVDGPQVMRGALEVQLGDIGWKTVKVG